MTSPESITSAQMHRIPACYSGSCEQGKRECPSKQACLIPEDEEAIGWLADMADAGKIVIFVGLPIAVLLLAWAIYP